VLKVAFDHRSSLGAGAKLTIKHGDTVHTYTGSEVNWPLFHTATHLERSFSYRHNACVSLCILRHVLPLCRRRPTGRTSW
jgi:hypothetical protein